MGKPVVILALRWSGIADLFVPLRDRQLRSQNRRTHLGMKPRKGLPITLNERSYIRGLPTDGPMQREIEEARRVRLKGSSAAGFTAH